MNYSWQEVTKIEASCLSASIYVYIVIVTAGLFDLGELRLLGKLLRMFEISVYLNVFENKIYYL